MRVSILRLCLIGVKIKRMENKKEKIREIWMRGVFGQSDFEGDKIK